MKIIVLGSQDEVLRKSLDYLRGPRVAVSGGSTFPKLFRVWAPEVKKRVGVGETMRFFPVDERQVPFEDPECNWKACWEDLLRPAGLEGQKAHHAVSASGYAAMLDGEFGGRPIIFDSVFLGMGEDGHTASLFPGSASLRDRKSLVLEITGPKPPVRRITLGLKPLCDCKTLVAVALGAGKAAMVRRLRAGDPELPITMALAGHGHAVLLLDKAAAGEA